MIYDMSQMTEGAPQVFVKRDWLNLQDQNNGNYQGNQMVLDTSQLANSNKYMAYREAYLAVPLLLTATTTSTPAMFGPADQAATNIDRAIGLKSWFGSIIHSITLDYAGTTIIQQTPLCSMWQQFSLLTTLSLQDVLLNGPSIGFYPDTSDSFSYVDGDSENGPGVANGANGVGQGQLIGIFPPGGVSNIGFFERQKILQYDVDAPTGGVGSATSSLINGSAAASLNDIYKGRIFNKGAGIMQTCVMAIIRLKDIHPFFSQVPLLKGVFMRLTLNLNQPSVTLTGDGTNLVLTEVQCPLGGVNPIQIANRSAPGISTVYDKVQNPAGPLPLTFSPTAAVVEQGGSSLSVASGTRMIVSLAVGAICLNQTQKSSTAGVQEGPLAKSVFLYVPAYTFNPTFEEAYLASPTKTIVYSDLYQFQTAVATPGNQFNFLITNGIANVKSVLVLPFFAKIASPSTVGGVANTTPAYQSPFDPAGCGPTSPLAQITNFNVVVAGQNMIYNTQKFTYEQYMNQLQGCNSVNANLVNGLTSSLISQYDFDNSYCYYYTNCSRMLPVDEAVPKSVQIQGQNLSARDVQYIVFIEYGVQVSVDVLTGSRV